MDALEEVLRAMAARHKHLCPRQVLGARIALAGAAFLGLEIPREDKRLLAIVETDGCFADAVEVTTGCTVGHRRLRVEDYGKVAATFVDVKTGQAVRVSPGLDVRERARDYAPEEKRRYYAQLHAYQIMPDEELLDVRSVELRPPLKEILSRPGIRVNCASCGEEIINERGIRRNGALQCRSCAGDAYYTVLGPSRAAASDRS
ncbi:MAG: FmdE family protein [Anaerolineae bacterium]